MNLRWAAAALSFAALGSSPAPPAFDPAGLWGAQISRPVVHGTAVIDGRTATWSARIGGYEVPVARDGARVRWTLPGGAGSFDGRLQPGNAISGTWVQPPTLLAGNRYATPVWFVRSAAGVWTAQVRPLEDRATLYLDVSRAPDGSLHAFLRNPEANIGAGRPFAVTLAGTALAFVNADDAHDTVAALVDPAAGTFTANVDGLGTATFTRRGRDGAVGFYPRTPQAAWSYRAPLPLRDGWNTGTLAAAGISSAPLARLIGERFLPAPDSARSPYVQSLLIARHGKLVLDEYFYGFDPWRTHDMRSASKSFTGLMLGIALDRGAPIALREPVLRAFPQYAAVANDGARKRRITIEDLVSMRSGLACDDNDDKSPGNEDAMYAQTAQTDYYRYALDLPMAADPGGPAAVYCTAGINLVGGAIRGATGIPLVEFFERFVATPLQIADYHANLSPNGDAYAGGGAYLRPRDQLKLGQLYLDRGVWNGRRVVSAAWIERSVRQHAAFPSSAYAPAHGYGYAWHLFGVRSGHRTYREWMAQGNGGQLVMVFPELDAVVGITAANYNNFPVWRHFFEDDVPNCIVPALLSAPACSITAGAGDRGRP